MLQMNQDYFYLGLKVMVDLQRTRYIGDEVRRDTLRFKC